MWSHEVVASVLCLSLEIKKVSAQSYFSAGLQVLPFILQVDVQEVHGFWCFFIAIHWPARNLLIKTFGNINCKPLIVITVGQRETDN
jgi:hypothetical protein